MATYKAISAGDASTLGIWETWDGAAWVAALMLPSLDDDVYTNNNIVTITTSQSYNSWNRSSVAAPLSIIQGGQFQIDGANEITTQGTIYASGLGYTNKSTSSTVVRLLTHTNIYNHIGDIINNGMTYTIGLINEGTEDLTIIGDIYGTLAAVNLAYGFVNTANINSIIIIGNLIAQYRDAFLNYFSTIQNLTITGNQIGGIDGAGLKNQSGAIVNGIIIGNQIAGGYYAIYNRSTGTEINVTGNAYASTSAAAIYNSQDTSTIIYTGNIYNNLSVMAIYSPTLFLNVTPTTVWEFSDFGSNTQYLYGAGVNTGHPTEADVRKDTVYGPNDEFEGTCAVAPPSTVNEGVPTDDTVGTYALSGDLITRLEQCSTVAITGAQIAAYNS